MRSKFAAAFCLLVFSVLALTSCATTKVTNVWKDSSYQAGPVKKVLVICVIGNPDWRRFFELEFAEQLKAHGSEAVTSYGFLSTDDKPDKDKLVSKVRELGADAVLVTRLLGMESSETDVAGEAFGMGSFYSVYGADIGGAGYSYENDIRIAETRLFETKTEKSIWAARSKIWMTGQRTDVINSYVKVMTNKLADDRMIR